MNPYDLAWKGTTTREKRELLEYSKNERDRLIAEGNAKDGYLGLASTCVDIIGTAKAGIKEADSKLNSTESGEWKALLDEATTVSRESVSLAEKLGTENWSSSDFEVAGAIIVKTQSDDVVAIEKAKKLFAEGQTQAKKEGDRVSEALITGQLIRAGIASKNIDEVKREIDDLYRLISTLADSSDDKNISRLYKALAEGSKYLAIYYAEKGGSENQIMKAKNL
jgi:hypothetical protein